MALISIVISLLLDRGFLNLHDLRDYGWLRLYLEKAEKAFFINSGILKLIFVLIVPMTIIIALQYYLADFLFGLFYVVMNIAILYFCLGPSSLNHDIDSYIDARSMGDDDEALHYAGSLTEKAASTAPDQQTSDVTKAILNVANERVFAVLFWFVLLGPMAVVFYRLVTTICKQDGLNIAMSEIASSMHAVLAWAPARLLAMGYALTGHFDGALNAYRNRPDENDLLIGNHDVLINTGMGAIRDHDATDELSKIKTAKDLAVRSILVWVTVLSLLTLGGWLG